MWQANAYKIISLIFSACCVGSFTKAKDKGYAHIEAIEKSC